MKIFLSVPFSGYVDEAGVVEDAYRQSIERLIDGLRASEHTVYCALEYTEWTATGAISPEDEFRHDFEQVDLSEKVLVLLEEHISAGVQLECGYAYARGKRLQLYQIGKPAWSNIAFARLSGDGITTVQDVDDFVNNALNGAS